MLLAAAFRDIYQKDKRKTEGKKRVPRSFHQGSPQLLPSRATARRISSEVEGLNFTLTSVLMMQT